MSTTRVSAKLYFDAPIDTHAFTEVFHGWIRDQKLPELMIDVVDYGHVHHGPHVYFCGHESDYVVDAREGRLGLLYVRKRVPDDAPSSAVRDGLRRLFTCARLLEEEKTLQGLRFATNEVRLAALDRLRVPNTQASFDAEVEELTPVATRLFGASYALAYDSPDPREPLAIRLQATEALPLAQLVERIA